MTIAYDKRVLVAGGAGFIGCNFLTYAVPKFPHIHFTCIDKLNYASNQAIIKRLEAFPNFRFTQLDLSENLEQLLDLTRDITDIINFAAESCVDRSFSDPVYFTRNNILATQNLLECHRLNRNVKYFLHISTDEVYGDQRDNVNEDDHFMNPTNPYSASKAAIDLIIQAYQHSYKLPITILRPNNVYGPLQYPEKIIPLTIKCLHENKPIPIHGNGTHKRRYLYVLDLVSAIEIVWRNQEVTTNQIYNVGGTDVLDNISLVRLIMKVYQKPGQIQYTKDRNYNDSSYSIDTTKITSLGWRPQTSITQGLTLCKQFSDLPVEQGALYRHIQ